MFSFRFILLCLLFCMDIYINVEIKTQCLIAFGVLFLKEKKKTNVTLAVLYRDVTVIKFF